VSKLDLVPRFLVPACVLALAATACQGEAPKAEQLEQQQEKIEKIAVELPASPNFDEGKAPLTWEDGTYSIYGLRKELDANLAAGAEGKEIEIKGWVQEIYQPPVCAEGESFCPLGKQSHFWITDSEGEQGKKRAMMVVAYKFAIPDFQAELWEGQPLVVPEIGKQYTIKGKFVRFSSTGFAHDQGLLEFVAYKAADPKTGEMVWIYPPGAAWHPLEVARIEEENKAMAAQAAEEAEKFKERSAAVKGGKSG
jgi:hypothetical protein